MLTNFTEPSASASFFYDCNDERASCDDHDYPDHIALCRANDGAHLLAELMEKELKELSSYLDSDPCDKRFLLFVPTIEEYFHKAFDKDQQTDLNCKNPIEKLEAIHAESDCEEWIYEIFEDLLPIFGKFGGSDWMQDSICSMIEINSLKSQMNGEIVS